MNGYFLPTADLPEDFVCPALFHRIVELDLVHGEPWHLLVRTNLTDSLL